MRNAHSDLTVGAGRRPSVPIRDRHAPTPAAGDAAEEGANTDGGSHSAGRSGQAVPEAAGDDAEGWLKSLPHLAEAYRLFVALFVLLSAFSLAGVLLAIALLR